MSLLIKSELIVVAVKFWSDFYRKKLTIPMHEGSRNPLEITKEKIDIFQSFLNVHLTHWAHGNNMCSLSNDWTSDRTLQIFCEDSNLSSDLFPANTTMWIDFKEGTVDVEIGGKADRIYPVQQSAA